MFQRLKGAIDSRIAEEQARQRASQSSPSRSNSDARKPTSRASSPAVRTSRVRQPENKGGDSAQKGPDPKEFEPEFVLDDDDLPSRSITPRPVQPRSDGTQPSEASAEKAPATDGGQQLKEGKELGDAVAQATTELPTDVRVKLRKLEKLESRYQELLRSYRIAHARVTAIEPFENALRENTPLTSINDPGALVEYLNQVNLKGDMVLDELKRVSAERTAFKQKLEEAEKSTKEARDEVASLRERKIPGPDNIAVQANHSNTTASVAANGKEVKAVGLSSAELEGTVIKSPVTPAKPRTPSIPGLSLFSPKSKPAVVPESTVESEEFFSYDSELPRLETELKESQNEVFKLSKEITGLKEDLAVARESAQNMVQTLEVATRDLNLMKEQKDRLEMELDTQRHKSEETAKLLQADLDAADTKARDIEIPVDIEKQAAFNEHEKALSEELEDVIAEKESAEAQIKQLQRELDDLLAALSRKDVEHDQNLKRVKTLNGLVENLRQQLATAEQEVHRHRSELNGSQTSVKPLQLQLASQSANTNGMSAETSTVVEPNGTKKKNKKKKKGSKLATELENEVTLDMTRSIQSLSPSGTLVDADDSILESNEIVAKLEGELQNLRTLLQEKDAAIDRLHGKLKDQEELREEIESLRDDLVSVGQEHVEAKEKIKDFVTEKTRLEKKASDIEQELSELRNFQGSNAKVEQARMDLAAQFDELRTKAASLQTDLSVAQQLASSRFKDLTDLRNILQKAQPELATLRNENGELKAAKEQLSVRVIELQKIEVRHNNLRIELTDLRKAMTDKDAEMKTLLQKRDQEGTGRLKLEDAYKRGGQDLQKSETERKSLADSLEKVSKDLNKSREELGVARSRIRELEDSLSRMERESEGLREDIELKTAQYASAESLMSSMRDQTAEMATQTKEARERCESLEEELADAHRLLSERSREGETMRRLLAEVEGRAEARVREMKDRMDVALEERDKAEDEASTVGRRRARELEEVRNKLRDVERSLRRSEEDKEELEVGQRDWKKRREELEHKSELFLQETENVKRAMGELRDALDESEKQARELEKQKAELRHSVEDLQLRHDKLQKSSKAMSDELRSVQAPKTRATDSQIQSPRSSMDSTPSRSKLGSPAPKSRTSSALAVDTSAGPTTPSMDYVYLKNILLQFLEQRDKKHQMQLIPVLGMLLHFDRKDEQKWMAAISTK